jgi:hypothetical protein
MSQQLADDDLELEEGGMLDGTVEGTLASPFSFNKNTEKALKKGVGRPKDKTLWEHYGDLGNRRAKCNYCDAVMEGRGVVQETHLLNCSKSTEAVKSAMHARAASRAPSSTASIAEPPPRKKRQSTMASHYGTTPVTKEQASTYDTLFLRAIAVAGLSFSIADNPAILELLHALRPEWKPAGKF